MKHIKSFNESKGFSFTNELREFCKNNLAYIVDEGFEYYTDSVNDGEILLFINGSKYIKFNDILPDFIPFIELLSEKVDINDITVRFHKQDFSQKPSDWLNSIFWELSLTMKVDEILSDELVNPIFNIPSIISIRIELQKKKISTLSRIKSFFKK